MEQKDQTEGPWCPEDATFRGYGADCVTTRGLKVGLTGAEGSWLAGEEAVEPAADCMVLDRVCPGPIEAWDESPVDLSGSVESGLLGIEEDTRLGATIRGILVDGARGGRGALAGMAGGPCCGSAGTIEVTWALEGDAEKESGPKAVTRVKACGASNMAHEARWSST